jgi:hypothetical protein
MEEQELYSKWLLRPHNLEVRKAYTQYLREQVKIVSPHGIIIWGIITLIFLGVTLKANEFKLLMVPEKQTMGPNCVFFIISGAQCISILIPYLFGQKYMAAFEFITPMFALCFLLLVVPTFFDAPKKSNYLVNATL